MVVKSATMKRLLDIGVSEPIARRLADGRKWDDVVKLTFYEWLTIGQVLRSAKNITEGITNRELYDKVQEIGSGEGNLASAQEALDRFSQELVTTKHGNYVDEVDFGLLVDDLNRWKKGGPKEEPVLLDTPYDGFQIIPQRSLIDETEPYAFLHGNKVHLGVWRDDAHMTFYERNGRYLPHFELDTWYYLDFSSETDPMPQFDYEGKGRWPDAFVGTGSKHHYLLRWRKSDFVDKPGTVQPWLGQLQQIALSPDIGEPWGFADDRETQSRRGGVVKEEFSFSDEPLLIYKIPNVPKGDGLINYPFTFGK